MHSCLQTSLCSELHNTFNIILIIIESQIFRHKLADYIKQFPAIVRRFLSCVFFSFKLLGFLFDFSVRPAATSLLNNTIKLLRIASRRKTGRA